MRTYQRDLITSYKNTFFSMKYHSFIAILATIATSFYFVSCNGCSSTKEEATQLISPYDDEDDFSIELPDEDVVDVPYTEASNLKIVQVLINDRINKEMIFDTGASYTQITLKEARYLYSEGVLTDDDILGAEKFGDANGNITVNMVVNLRKLVLGGKLVITNVKATVVANGDAPLLLGQTVLAELPQYTVDNENKVVKFKIK